MTRKPRRAAGSPSAEIRAIHAEALAHHQAGRLTEAERLYHRVLALDPRHADCLHLLGVIAYQQARYPAATASIARAIALEPGIAAYHSNLGNALHKQGRLDQAIAAHRRAVELEPDHPTGHINLGLALQDRGRLDEAIACLRRATLLSPHHAKTHVKLGLALQQHGSLDLAEAAYRRALDLAPDLAEAHTNLGTALQLLGRCEESLVCHQRAVALDPASPEAQTNLGNALRRLGRLEDAAACHGRAVALKPDFAEAQTNLGGVLQELGRLDQAVECYRRAIALRPDYPEAYSNLGTVLLGQGALAAAIESYRRAIEIDPDFPEPHTGLGNALYEAGRLDEAVECHRRAAALRPTFFQAHSNLMLSRNYLPNGCPAEALAEARRFGARATELATAFTAWAAPSRPLRVGLVSGDLLNHPVGHFLEAVIAALDPARIELHAYVTHQRGDDLTARLKPHFAGWTSLAWLDDRAAAERIHADGIDVLIDLAGHTGHNRLPVFAWRPAPVQVSWLGYFATTGLAEMDYLLASPVMVPPGEEGHFSEKIWRLPETHWCFTPPRAAPEVAPPPALANGSVTFGCFNNLTKLNDGVVALWARVLDAVPGSRLLLKAKQLGDAVARAETTSRFAVRGIGPERLILAGPTPRVEMLAEYHRVDIALDPFPFPGGTTSAEGLWMGVPLLTRRGDRFVSHQGEGILHAVGLDDWIAADDDDYLAKAVSFAADIPRLAALRAGMRERVRTSPLFDAPRFARHFEAALEAMVQAREN